MVVNNFFYIPHIIKAEDVFVLVNKLRPYWSTNQHIADHIYVVQPASFFFLKISFSMHQLDDGWRPYGDMVIFCCVCQHQWNLIDLVHDNSISISSQTVETRSVGDMRLAAYFANAALARRSTVRRFALCPLKYSTILLERRLFVSIFHCAYLLSVDCTRPAVNVVSTSNSVGLPTYRIRMS